MRGLDIRVGASRRLLDLPSGLPVAGYVVASRLAERANDILDVRVIAIESGAAPVLIVSYDLLYGSASLTAQLRSLVAAAHDIPPERILVNGTHSHCSPRDTTAHTNANLVAALAATGAMAVDDALAARSPVRVISGVTDSVGIGRNRRDTDGFIDDAAQLVVFQRLDGSVAASIVNFPCHPVVLDEETCAYHPDFVGPMRTLIEAAIGGRCLFLQGFAGDANPVVLDHTIAETERVGARAAGPIISTFADLLTTEKKPNFWNLSEDREELVSVPSGIVHRGPASAASAILTTGRRELWPPAAPSASARPAAREMEEWITDLLRKQDGNFNSMEMIAADTADVELEVQSIALGNELLIVAFPGEPLGRTRADVVARFPSTHVLTVGYSNGSPGYLPYAEAYAESGYEIGCSIVEPGTVELLVARAIDPRNHTAPADRTPTP